VGVVLKLRSTVALVTQLRGAVRPVGDLAAGDRLFFHVGGGVRAFGVLVGGTGVIPILAAVDVRVGGELVTADRVRGDVPAGDARSEERRVGKGGGGGLAAGD